MNDLRRILEDDPTESERRLLGAASLDAPPTASKGKVLAALGAAAVTTTAATGGAAAATTGVTLALKWLAIGVMATAITWATVDVWAPPQSIAHPSPAIVVVPPAGHAPSSLAVDTPPVMSTVPETHAAEPASGKDGTRELIAAPPRRSEGTAPREPRLASAPAVRGLPTAEHEPVAKGPATDPAAASALATEVLALGEARRALTAGDPATALGMLDAFHTRFAHPALAPEATVLRIEALIALGRMEGARGLGSQMISEQPNSPYSQRVRSLLTPNSRP